MLMVSLLRGLAAMTITPTGYEKGEWSRFAQAAYGRGENSIGHRFSVAASLPTGAAMDLAYFDGLQRDYRAWLSFNEYPAV
jgi:hypothetical protein